MVEAISEKSSRKKVTASLPSDTYSDIYRNSLDGKWHPHKFAIHTDSVTPEAREQLAKSRDKYLSVLQH